jgi:hypothetical protein
LELNSHIFISPSNGSHAETGREKADRFLKGSEARRTKALSAKSRGLTQKFF